MTAAAEEDIAGSSITKDVRFKVADEMTVYETAIWIWTFGWNNRWAEAKVYSESFFKNQIKGDLLSSLSLSMLEEDLGIHNPDHCMAIKHYIDVHLQETNLHQCGSPIAIGPAEQSQGSTGSLDQATTFRSSMRIASASEDSLADSVCNNDASLFFFKCYEDSISSKRTLVLTIRPEQRDPVREKENVKSILAKLNYKVQIYEYETPDKYILIFEDKEKALKANIEFATLGYQLEKYLETRPSPNNPVMFKTLSLVTVRLSKSLTSRKVAILQKDTIILVDKKESCGVRLIYFQVKDPFEWVSLHGWVSLHSNNGITHIERL